MDANNQYGASMSMKMPTGNFRWREAGEISKMDVSKIDPEGDTCFIMEVDLEYPRSLHDDHSDYPLAVESKIIQEHQLSPFNVAFLKNNNEKFKPSRKLCPNLQNG